jgi:hypothetical protein
MPFTSLYKLLWLSCLHSSYLINVKLCLRLLPASANYCDCLVCILLTSGCPCPKATLNFRTSNFRISTDWREKKKLSVCRSRSWNRTDRTSNFKAAEISRLGLHERHNDKTSNLGPRRTGEKKIIVRMSVEVLKPNGQDLEFQSSGNFEAWSSRTTRRQDLEFQDLNGLAKKKTKKQTCPSVDRGPKTRRTGPRISKPVPPRNIVRQTGRFCRGTLSDGQVGSAAERRVGCTHARTPLL